MLLLALLLVFMPPVYSAVAKGTLLIKNALTAAYEPRGRSTVPPAVPGRFSGPPAARFNVALLLKGESPRLPLHYYLYGPRYGSPD
jgi:hypothetical protein